MTFQKSRSRAAETCRGKSNSGKKVTAALSESLHRFDAFELNWNTRQLFREGQPVALEPKALELIRYLLLHRDRAFDKEKLAVSDGGERQPG